MIEGRTFGRERKSRKLEPGYIRTVPSDGRKYIDPNEFLKDERVREQIRRLAEEPKPR